MKLKANPTPAAFAEAWTEQVLKPAVEALAGADGRISRNELKKAENLVGAERLAADELVDLFEASGVSSSVSAKKLLDSGHALALSEGTRAAGVDGKISADEAKRLATLADDFTFLTRSTIETGIISDLDSTIIPPEKNGTVPPPYPGVAALLSALEFGGGGAAGDVHYVSARTPERVTEVPDYLAANGVPAGTIDTGKSSVPWAATREKVADISRVFAANPDQKFVLFGDSNHVDPEVYTQILKRFPDQVGAAFIHQVTRTLDPDRVQGMHVINNYAQAAATLFHEGLLDEASARKVMTTAQREGLPITNAEIDALLRP